MNRVKFMAELEALLQNIPTEEREEAMQFYNDYFDDAGMENEPNVIAELESPAKVAATIKAGLGRQPEDAGEYTECGYKDERFEDKEEIARRGASAQNTSGQAYEYQGGGKQGEKEPPRTSRTLKIILIIAIILVGAPIAIPVGLGIAGVVIGCVAALFCAFIALVLAAVTVTIVGIWLFGIGLVTLIPQLVVGLALVGTGLILAVLGVIGTVISVKLCVVVFPGICRGIVWVCRWPFHRKAVA